MDSIPIQAPTTMACSTATGSPAWAPSSRSASIETHHLRWDAVVFPQYHGDSDFTLRCKSKGIAVKTSLDLVIFNSSETSGLGRINNMNKLWQSLVSMRSNYNLRKRLVFYRRHGVMPLYYWGLGSTYVKYIGSFFKRTYFKPRLATTNCINDEQQQNFAPDQCIGHRPPGLPPLLARQVSFWYDELDEIVISVESQKPGQIRRKFRRQ
ncbi:hypothetical protein ACQ86N_19370 [Puia sp. P3]|uniref:hypothetical protein n=1 Tax=Puia sp. P3 TaxID=3423952 RepID=UPI003D66C556